MPQTGNKIEVIYDSIDGLGKQTAPAVPASTVAKLNPFSFAVLVRVVGGTVTQVSVGGAVQAVSSPATVLVDVDESITLTYSVAPTWTWFGIPGK
jgi:hypothetical protein